MSVNRGSGKKIIYLFSLIFLLLLTGCTTPPPDEPRNVCSIFKQYPEWYWEAQQVKKDWGLPINVLMAIMYQESRFNATARPPRTTIFWVIPWVRPTSAFGYSQAINSTWVNYQKKTGNKTASRDNFGDAANFIGWYSDRAHKRAGISKYNAYQLYLAYHEGIGGYERGTYRHKKWLLRVSRKVSSFSYAYRGQLRRCESSLPEPSLWWRLFH